MHEWLARAAEGVKTWAPLLTEEDAIAIARDVYTAWPDEAPGIALRKFLREVPVDWSTMPSFGDAQS